MVTPAPSTLNISEGGLRLEGVNLPPDRIVKLFVTLPLRRQGKRLLLLSGQIVWTESGTAGVRFLDTPPFPLRQFINEQHTLPPN